jgi:hypothetical protein
MEIYLKERKGDTLDTGQFLKVTISAPAAYFVILLPLSSQRILNSAVRVSFINAYKLSALFILFELYPTGVQTLLDWLAKSFPT